MEKEVCKVVNRERRRVNQVIGMVEWKKNIIWIYQEGWREKLEKEKSMLGKETRRRT